MTLFILVIFTTLVFSILKILTNLWRRKTYWKRRGVPGPESTLLLGNLHQLSAGYRTLSPVDQYREWTRCFGPIYGVQFGATPMLVISDLELAHEVLTNKFSLFHQRKAYSPHKGDPNRNTFCSLFDATGLRWKRFRTIHTSSILNLPNLRMFLRTMNNSAQTLSESLEKYESKESDKFIPVEMSRYCHEYTLDVNVRIAMGKHETGEEHKSSLGDLSELAFATFGNRWMDWASWTFPSLGTFFKYVDMIVSKFETDHFAEFTRKIMDVINERKKCPSYEREFNEEDDKTDLIDLFLKLEVESSELLDEPCDGAFEQLEAKVILMA